MENNLDVENGNFTRIHNRTLEELIKIKLSDHEWRVIVLIWRLTYGWQKKEKYITNKTLQEKTELSDVAICRVLKKLKDRNIIIKNDNENPPTTKFNKYFTTWKQLSKKITLIKNDNKHLSRMITPIIKNDNEKSLEGRLKVKQRDHKEISTKESIKEISTITKPVLHKVKNLEQEINQLLALYEKKFPQQRKLWGVAGIIKIRDRIEGAILDDISIEAIQDRINNYDDSSPFTLFGYKWIKEEKQKIKDIKGKARYKALKKEIENK